MPLNITISTDHPAKVRTPLLVLQHFQDDREPLGAGAAVDEALSGLLSRLMGRGDFKGKQGETLVVYPADPGFPAERASTSATVCPSENGICSHRATTAPSCTKRTAERTGSTGSSRRFSDGAHPERETSRSPAI